MSEEKIRQLQEFVDTFTDKLKDAYNIYEAKQKKVKILKKSLSQIEPHRKTEDDKFPSLSYNNYKPILINNNRDSNNNNLITTSIYPPPVWKPPRGTPNYFEQFKRLENVHELSSWEKVCKYNNLY